MKGRVVVVGEVKDLNAYAYIWMYWQNICQILGLRGERPRGGGGGGRGVAH